MGRLDGKLAIVTGGARGQGAAHAKLMASEGAAVLITDVLEEEGRRTAATHPSIQFARHDVADKAEWDAVVARALEWQGRVDVLVNNAGVLQRAKFLDDTPENFERHFEVMQLGCFLGMQAAARPMAGNGGGSIVNVSSTTAVTGSRDAVGYTAAKWAIRGLSLCAALDLAPLGIRVNTVIPGYIDTDMSRSNSDEHNAAFLARIRLHRAAHVSEVAATVLHLACDESSYITGAEIKIDGGLTI